jgi:hypothetical protein
MLCIRSVYGKKPLFKGVFLYIRILQYNYFEIEAFCIVNIMKNPEEIQNKPLFKTTHVTSDALYEMIYDSESGKTSFIKASQDGHIEAVENIETSTAIYRPFPPNNALVSKRIIHFPSAATPYQDERQILGEIKDFMHKYLDVSPVFEEIATYYVLFTWMFDKFNEVPYLRAIGDFGSGKSRFLQTIGILCYKPVFTSGASTASPIFRIIDEVHGTLIIDEADYKNSDMTADIIKILNTGYQKGMSLLRSEGKGVFEVKTYDVYCPKIVATREPFTDKALESRCLTEEMGSTSLREDIPRTLEDDFYKQAELIRNKLLMWRLKNYFIPIERSQEIIKDIHPRLNQIVMPLLSIIKDSDIRESLKKFIVKYNADLIADRGMTWESDVIFAILKLDSELHLKEITVKEIADEVNLYKDSNDDKLQARKVGWLLRARLQLKPFRTRRGFILTLDENRKKLNMWKERFGITDADIRGERVNNVNIVEREEDLIIPTAEELGFGQ